MKWHNILIIIIIANLNILIRIRIRIHMQGVGMISNSGRIMLIHSRGKDRHKGNITDNINNGNQIHQVAMNMLTPTRNINDTDNMSKEPNANSYVDKNKNTNKNIPNNINNINPKPNLNKYQINTLKNYQIDENNHL